MQATRVSAMIASGEHLLGMINAVLDVSQIEADRLALHPDEIEMPHFVRTCLDVVRPAAEAKGLELMSVASEPVHLFADPMRLRQVLINLLGNAIKFTPFGQVELRVNKLPGGVVVRLEVADTGPGIRAKYRDKLFQTFQRLNAGAVSGIEGSGVGLALAARLTQLMGGRIGHRDNPGGGSVFWVELPVRGANGSRSTGTETSLRAMRKGLRVLVVDDEALNRNIAAGFLRFGEHEVVCLENGAEAVRMAADQDFDVILMDVRMPGMNGLEATGQIRALPSPRGRFPWSR